MKRILFTLLFLMTNINLFAQNNNIEMADMLRNNGKIYVVVTCIVIILAGLLFYLFALDRRVKLLEKKSSNKNQL